MCGSLRQLAHRLSLLPPDNEVRRKHEELLLDKLYDMGILSVCIRMPNFALVEQLLTSDNSPSPNCRRWSTKSQSRPLPGGDYPSL